MENREQLKEAVKQHLIKTLADEIAQEADFKSLKDELVSQLIKIKKEAKNDKEEDYIPYTEPQSKKEIAFKKLLGFYIKDEFCDRWKKNIDAYRKLNQKLKSEQEPSEEKVLEPIGQNYSSLHSKLASIREAMLEPAKNTLEEPFSLGGGIENFGELTIEQPKMEVTKEVKKTKRPIKLIKLKPESKVKGKVKTAAKKPKK